MHRWLRKLNCIMALTFLGVLLCGCGSEDMVNSENEDVKASYADSSEKSHTIEISESEQETAMANSPFGKSIDPEELFKNGVGVFSWDHLPNVQDVRCMKNSNITEIYQYIRPEYTDEDIIAFLAAMNEVDIDVYILDGEPEWAYETEYQAMKDVLDRTRYFNSLVDEDGRIRGILYDVEPYVLERWHKDPDRLLEEYCNNIMAIKEESREDNESLDICICVPFSYDKMGHDKALRTIIKESDQIFVLNYSKGNEIDNLKREVALARGFKKRIVNVYELQPGLLSQTTNTITYYKDGVDAVNLNYQEIMDAYPNHDIGIAYHTLEYLRLLTIKH